MNYLIKISTKILLILTVFLITGCGDAFKFKKTNSKTTPVNVDDRVERNIGEGRGFRLGDLKGGSNTYDFASSNELWRASLTILDFMPLVNADYSGGIIITDWYSDSVQNESLKITIRFLSNEIASNSLKIIVHEKKCASLNNCIVKELNSTIKDELNLSILKRAKFLEKEKKKTKK